MRYLGPLALACLFGIAWWMFFTNGPLVMTFLSMLGVAVNLTVLLARVSSRLEHNG
jgi:hypothetical protein